MTPTDFEFLFYLAAGGFIGWLIGQGLIWLAKNWP
jgi:hypothetical protein